MDKFGFVYADIDLQRAHDKADEYIKMGYKANVIHKQKSFDVVIKLEENNE
jgi:hypothetical protein